ncbi:uncharacterized protein B0I36DRAFT_348229 [Microdochium trichocladiopsis]|uniref:Uncharacterized protein n=1 Tax=Microdochium trichocladiopsis TaxID=1682393 RepID=A0A9P9BRS7_9PEZI|nr:uncharacterized protein B0I36DRAFT_348229 [Microdochium trichocladiopsis]KAH7033130.1 hypothetical protein B0I36DRAFT_348229 [Microdochium trichocladiopsis]
MEYRTPKDENAPAIQRFGKWLRLKQYQIEVTFGVYMFTPVEKSVFWSVVFLFSSLTLLACVLYLPQHIVFISNRAWFYVNGYHAGEQLSSSVSSAGGLVTENKDKLALSVSSALGSAATAATTAGGQVVREL